jgi:hypothetical protein
LHFTLRAFSRTLRLHNYIIYLSGDRHKRVEMFFIHRARVPLAFAPRWKDFVYDNVMRRKLAPALSALGLVLLDGLALLRIGKFGNVQ